MAETTTANFGWTKPDPGASANTWGTTLNGTTDKIDAVVWANQQAAVGIGSIVMFAGATAPPNWMICDGRALVITAYQALYNVIQTAFNVAGVPTGSFNIPNLQQYFPLGAGPNPLGQTAGSFAVTIATANLPQHTHPISDPQHFHYITDQAHNHGVNQWYHSHAIATGGHSHGVSMGQHTHGYSYWGVTGSGQNVRGDIPSYYQGSIAGTTGGASNLSGSTDNPGNLGGGTDGQTSSISLNASGSGLGNTNYGPTNITATGNAGSGTALNVMPPFVALNFVIRFQ